MEMNAHIPQSYESMVELEEIAAIPHHIITPRHAKPMIGVFQDTLVGSYRLTQPGIQFTLKEFMNLMMWNKRFDGTLPKPRVGDRRYTGQQVLGALLPPINMEMGNKTFDREEDKSKDSVNYVRIMEGDIQQGVVDGDIYMKPSKGIIHVTYNDHGPKDTVDLLDALQNTVEHFLVMNGFSVGISDLIADEKTKEDIDAKIQERKKAVEQLILQVHLDLFDNNTGKTNQQEFEDQVFGILNQATSDAGSLGQQSLSKENRLLAMVRSGSKGEPLNVAQMMACLGQTAIEGKRIPYGFTDRTLPHYKKYDDSAESRGFIESSFIRGLTPQQFFFHAMSGREGLIDTAVKSVTADTEILIQENGETKWTTIGVWIDDHLARADPKDVEHHATANMEFLPLKHEVYIPTCSEKGVVSWGQLTAVTRHDPGECLYRVKTLGGRSVTVAKSQSLIVWDEERQGFHPKPTPEVKVGEYVPTTLTLNTPPSIHTQLKINKYIEKRGGPKHSLPESMELNERNGIFFGLYLAEGNSHIKSGYVNIANNDQTIRTFAMEWFQGLGISVSERFRTVVNNTRTGTTTGVSNGVRGFSRPLGNFLENFLGAGSANKYVPDEAFAAPLEFVRGLLNGYYSGDGTVDVKKGNVTVNSASKRLIEGISVLCSRFGVFGKMSKVQLKANNVMTPTERILPTYRFSICAKWATRFASEIPLLSAEKQERLTQIKHSHEHRNFPSTEDVVKDEIVSVEEVSVDGHPKLYDVTVPSTLNFAVANGMIVHDTAETGYIQRQLIKSMEDLIVHHDGTVRDANNNIVQYHYGEDGVNPTKIETQTLTIGKLSGQELNQEYGMREVDWSTVLMDGIVREPEEETAIAAYLQQLFYDQRMMVEGVFQKKTLDSGAVFAPVNLARMLLNVKVRFGLKPTDKTDLTPSIVLKGIGRILAFTHSYHKIWAALLRFHLAPHKLIVKERFTKEAFEVLLELIVANHMKAWVQPGDQVGIVAAQSIGEPATQLTLNSVDWDTEIVISKGGRLRTPQIGEWIDAYLQECLADETRKHLVQHLPNGQLYAPLPDDEDWKAASCDENGVMKWTKLEAVTRHPVVNEDGSDTILKVTLESGRVVKATKGKSFLTLQDGKIQGLNGSDLKVGDELPIANSLAMDTLGYVDSVSLRDVLPETAHSFPDTISLDRTFGYASGIYLAKGGRTNTTEDVLMPFLFGHPDQEKSLPDWALQACDEFIEGLVDGYFSSICTIDKTGLIQATSESQNLLVGIQFILARYGIYTAMSSYPSEAENATYTIRLPVKSSNRFAKRFTLILPYKQARLEENHFERKKEAIPFKWGTMGDMVWDKVKAIEEVRPMGEGWVYDVTVEETRNFLTKTVVAQKDTFHQAGVASKSAVTRGVPRLRELLKVTQNPKATSLTIYLQPEHRNNKDKAREVVQDLELTLLRNITDKVAIYWDEKDDFTVVEEDRELLEFYRLFERGLVIDEHLNEDDLSKWMLRLELNREEMFNRNISIQEVVSVIKAQFGGDVSIIYSDYNAQKLVMRIRLVDNGKKTKETAEQLDEFTNLKKFQNKLLNSIVIRGLPGIKAVTFRKDKNFVERVGGDEGKYEPVEQYVLDTDGSNFIKVMNHPAVDGTRLYSTNVWDVYEVLGIEAARSVLFNEINGPFAEVGVNYRHLCLLCDVMTRSGKLMSIDRYGINKNDIGTLAKASFEETEKILLKAALFGEMDPVTGVSANIMMGQPIRGGTAFSQIMLDDQALIQLLKDVDMEKVASKLEEEEAGDLSRLDESREKMLDPCATVQFQSSIVLPPAKTVMDEPDIELEILE